MPNIEKTKRQYNMKLTESDKLRLLVLNNSLDFEYLVNKSLCDLLEIDIKTSISFGNKSTSLSLASKVGILLDLKTIDKEDSTVLIKYMEIRNKFLHELECKTFENCFAIIADTGKYLTKRYKPSKELALEEQYKICYNKLTNDAAEIVAKKIYNSAIDAIVKRKQKTIAKAEELNFKKRVKEAIVDLDKNSLFQDYKIPSEKITELQRELVEKIYE